MLQKTRAVILHQLKYTDSGIIVQVYTRDFGRLSVIIKGMRSRKSGKHNVFFQPLSVLDIVVYIKGSRSIQILKEFSVSYIPADVWSDVKKSSIALFLGEMMTSVLKEESPQPEMFDFIESSVIYFNGIRNSFSNFHIAFLIGLCSYLGFEPGTRTSEDDRYFDLENGRFVSLPPVHGNYLIPEISEVLARFFRASYDQASTIPLTGALRNEVLDAIIRYYSVHLPGLKKINSLEVLKEIFR
jgi:DNA repair protein RecO (recombination protein O)